MTISDTCARWPAVLERLRLITDIVRLPRARLRFDAALNPDLIRRTHASFTMPHPRYRINTSQRVRQGRPMDPAYTDHTDHYVAVDSFRYYGVRDAGGKLVAYCDLGIYGDFAATDRLLGVKSDGVMYLLLADIACRLIDEHRYNYLMYDTYLGAQPGLREFKRKLGFAPYRIRYAIA